MLSNTSPTSIDAFTHVTSTGVLEAGMILVTEVTKLLGTPTVDEVRQHILTNFPGFTEKGKDEIGARMADTWKQLGSVKQTNQKRVSLHSQRLGNTWVFVDVPYRDSAKVDYWKQRETNLEAAYIKGKKRIEKEKAKFQKMPLAPVIQ